ncbi:Proteasome lid subunit RPN8/RPN11, contains Jab1/MPN metalloenzyme (JAMM) motif [Natronorubrum sediminis]|uniref:Proteasome lid subunit RPN8/RPN11, contains Jab1/MPN metalloenzyme (JAMM) motif n=1 Tax=Natronorubrum sediminis TaxID=640943 RepID=A0A1H6FQH8_9EURY|nr:desampylase [Natronorubrum sediminis]SEH13171.1 Proteasome lid subunit RPN8/RPN11, contains Jab1/MPN metalloenzyme (JAMM) motif [Natronorubrum sediminis]
MTDDLPTDAGPALVLPSEIRETILERARAESPEEICGIFGGEYDDAPGGTSRVRSHYPTENVAESPRTRYRIDPEAQLEAFERLEDAGEEIVGFYHSHPRGTLAPSATDVAAATWPDRSYLIVSLSPLEIGSWRWRAGEDQFERERIILSA